MLMEGIEMTVEQAKQVMLEMFQKQQAIGYAGAIMHWDAATGAPKSAMPRRAKSMGFISGLRHEYFVNPEVEEAIGVLYDNRDQLTANEKREIELTKKNYEETSKIPKEEMQNYQMLLQKAEQSWEEARETDNFDMFAPHLEEIIETLKRFAGYRGFEGHPYNLYLDDFEEGMTMEKLDQFFDVVKERLVPLIHEINASDKKIRYDFMTQAIDVEAQKKFGERFLDIMKFDLERGMLKESAHPFTMGADLDDVRLTSRYFEDMFLSGWSSIAHEGGHGIYEQNNARELKESSLRGGTSSGIHESQSRIYENNFCRNRAFMDYFHPLLKEEFPGKFDDVTTEELYEGINLVRPSLIRVEADELTYPLHVLIRYEIELLLVNNEIQVSDLPRVWNEKMEQYLGVVPSNNAEGVLQDVHWSSGLFGYFPTYALGSAYAAQMYNKMTESFNVEEALKRGDFQEILDWLSDRVHKYGTTKTPDEISMIATDELLNPKYYCDYLETKYRGIYGLNK